MTSTILLTCWQQCQPAYAIHRSLEDWKVRMHGKFYNLISIRPNRTHSNQLPWICELFQPIITRVSRLRNDFIQENRTNKQIKKARTNSTYCFNLNYIPPIFSSLVYFPFCSMYLKIRLLLYIHIKA